MQVRKLFLLSVTIALIVRVNAGELMDSIKYKNTIKYNLSAPLLWGKKNFIVEYERVVKPYQTLNVSLGYRSFPKLIGAGKSDSAILVRTHKNLGGISASIDYRFYLKNENKHRAPRGVYLGPYFDYFNNKIENTVSTFYSDALSFTLTTKFEVLSLGAQLGYQFVFFDRLTMDICFVGPSFSWYNVYMKLDGEASIKNEDIFNAISDYILETYPAVGLLFDEYKISGSGRSSKLFYGYRYSFKVGYRF